MSFLLNLPPSVVAKQAKTEEDTDEPKKRSKEDWRKMKELEEMRKAGTAPAMQDEEGKDINPHIPQYIMQVPWYYGENRPTLKHQRPLKAEQEEKKVALTFRDDTFKKGVKLGPVATKFRKGACENCGSMTHKKKDCVERPRKIGARFTGDAIAPDEHLQVDTSVDYDDKRDRWKDYNPDEHKKIYEDFAKIEEAKQMLKERKVEEDLLEAGTSQADTKRRDEDSEDEDKYADDVDMPGQKFETKQRITVRNLRIREDTAKYLFNLDINSAYYDPKTRSMRQNPFQGKEQAEDFLGDNFARYSGDAQQFARKQVFAWDAYEHGTDVHLQADPTKLELLSREVVKRKDEAKTSTKDSILQKYGGEEHLEAPPKQLLLAQTEDYVEYSRHGNIIKGNEKVVVRSKYEEDVYINNHTSVWGSYWRAGQWGFKCCCSLIKESYCTGQAGIEAAQETSLVPVVQGSEEEEEEAPKSLLQQHQEKLMEKTKKKKKKKKKHRKKKKKRESSSSDSSDASDDSESERKKEKKLKKALQRETEHQQKVKELMTMDERKRPYNSMFEAKAPTEEELEAWRMKRQRTEDPMANFL